jgi:hypothetical protein
MDPLNRKTKLVAQSREQIQERVAKEQLERETIRNGIMGLLQVNESMTIVQICLALERDQGYLVQTKMVAQEIASLAYHSHVRRRQYGMWSLSPPKQCEAEIFIGGKRHPVH